MSNINCSACDELRTEAPTFSTSGTTTAVCNSLKNNTGLATNNGHNNETDLADAVDCLIGRMDDELKAYDVCDWKEFMHKFIPNNYEMLKAMLCGDAGQWANIEDLIERVDAMCALIEATFEHPVYRYGTVEQYGQTHPANRGGTIVEKNGSPLAYPATQQELSIPSWNGQNLGIVYGRMDVNSCANGACQRYEWIAPDFTGYYLSADLEYNDIIWYVDKATAQGWGITDWLWNAYTISSWTWTDYALGSNHTYGWFQLTIDENRMGTDYLTLVYRGTSYPNQWAGATRIQGPENAEKMYRHSCT